MSAEGVVWEDPPQYWEKVAYPAYIKAHRELFQGGDVERGPLTGRVPGMHVLEAEGLSMTEVFEQACEIIMASLREAVNRQGGLRE